MDLVTRLNKEPLPFAALLGIEVVSAAAERIVGEMTVREEMCTRPAVLHGGAVMAFADTLGALATIANLKEGAGTTTLESKTNFIGAAPLGPSRRRDDAGASRTPNDGLADPDYDAGRQARRAGDADATGIVNADRGGAITRRGRR